MLHLSRPSSVSRMSSFALRSSAGPLIRLLSHGKRRKDQLRSLPVTTAAAAYHFAGSKDWPQPTKHGLIVNIGSLLVHVHVATV